LHHTAIIHGHEGPPEKSHAFSRPGELTRKFAGTVAAEKMVVGAPWTKSEGACDHLQVNKEIHRCNTHRNKFSWVCDSKFPVITHNILSFHGTANGLKISMTDGQWRGKDGWGQAGDRWWIGAQAGLPTT
jgi:hypothetical protein